MNNYFILTLQECSLVRNSSFDINYISYDYTSAHWNKTFISLNEMTRPRIQTMNILCIIYHFRMFCVCTVYVYYGNDIKCNHVKVWFIAVNKLVIQSIAIVFWWSKGLYRMVIFLLFGTMILFKISLMLSFNYNTNVLVIVVLFQ